MKVHTFTVELRGVSFEVANDEKKLEQFCTQLANSLHHTILQTTFRTFQPQGVTGFLLLAESHLAIHSWPEKEYIHLTLATCRPCGKQEKQMIKNNLSQLSSTCDISETVSEF